MMMMNGASAQEAILPVTRKSIHTNTQEVRGRGPLTAFITVPVQVTIGGLARQTLSGRSSLVGSSLVKVGDCHVDFGLVRLFDTVTIHYCKYKQKQEWD